MKPTGMPISLLEAAILTSAAAHPDVQIARLADYSGALIGVRRSAGSTGVTVYALEAKAYLSSTLHKTNHPKGVRTIRITPDGVKALREFIEQMKEITQAAEQAIMNR